ncbi:MAG: aminoglycoside phosphotransferase [Deltaproteobacteria bacterium]|nr:MAG: aminoglycoside phosphotransferase [Deltaproteobacteria bacterium]
MKAMILAAGFGTRLLPFTENLPKSLFSVAGRPLLDMMICRLQDAGCEAVIINTHHLHEKVEAFIAGQNYPIPVHTRYEPVILGTGGAVKNVADFWDDRPFMVVNSDIVTDIDFREVYDFHLNHHYPVTLVLHDDATFNKVSADKNNFIINFSDQELEEPSHLPPDKKLAFTGIQVIDPEIPAFISEGIYSSSIDAYKKLISEGKKIKAFISKQCHWKDMGTPERYREAVIEDMAPRAFRIKAEHTGLVSSLCFPSSDLEITHTRLKGDGSDRKWYRLTTRYQSLVMVDHGIREGESVSEADAFVNIGRHLYDKGIPVPKIYLYDTFSGLVFLEDLGDVSLQMLVQDAENLEEVTSYYKSVIDFMIKLSVSGAGEFDLSWTYQTAYYDRELILEKECRYFVDAFLRGYLGTDLCWEDFRNEFVCLADKALECSVNGFMHRDMQSRNIMVPRRDFRTGSREREISQACDASPDREKEEFCFIDFQGGRIGPIQYDLASLLTDPYVNLPFSLQDQLVEYCIKRLSSFIQTDPDRFRTCYKYCSIARNLQTLGAFGYLSRVKGKTYFETYIPVALRTLKYNLSKSDESDFPVLKKTSENISR